MNEKNLTVVLILLFLLSLIYNNKIYIIIIFILHYKKEVPWYSDKQMNKNKIPFGNIDWMSQIKDSTDLRELSIPGTHDSCSSFFNIQFYLLWYANYQSQCQAWLIEDQLYSGIRYFDLRPAGDGFIYHGQHQTKYTFKQIFEIFADFLNNHPKEGLIVRIQFQYKNCGNNVEETKEKVIYQILDIYNDYLYKGNEVPTVGQLRKKIYVLLENLEYKNLLIWDNNDIIELQDYFRLFGIRKLELDKKRKLVNDYMFNNNKKKLIINHCSAIGRGVLTTLKYVAYSVNEIPYSKVGFRGIFAFDFPGEDLITHTINQNKSFINSEIELNDSKQSL